MTDAKIIAFPGREPTQPHRRDEAPSFEDFVYTEVVDFQTKAAELDTIAVNQGEDEFWTAVVALCEQITGWNAPDG